MNELAINSLFYFENSIELQENFGSFEYHYPDISIGTTGALPDGIDESSIDIFEDTYKRHCMVSILNV